MMLVWIYYILLPIAMVGKCQVKADLMIHHARIYTLNDAFEIATILVIHDGKILDVGNDELRQQYQCTDSLDARGAIIYPGFWDAHCHFAAQALDNYKLSLFGVPSYKAMLDSLGRYAAINKRPWIEGSGWDQEKWTDPSMPDRYDLDRLFPEIPVFLLRVDGHAALINTRAMQVAGLDTLHPSIDMEWKSGSPSGIIYDRSIEKVRAVLPGISDSETRKAVKTQEEKFLRYGLTAVVEPGIDTGLYYALKSMYHDRKLQLRSHVYLLPKQGRVPDVFMQEPEPEPDESFRLCGLKIYADGALGSRGACLLNPYHDKPDHHGHLLISSDSLELFARVMEKHHWQMAVHAIGDSTVRSVLNVFKKVLKRNNQKRWRIEHAQIVNPEDYNLFKNYQIIPSVQPTHATSDCIWVSNRLGKHRENHGYSYRNLLKLNGWIPLGTDFPVEDINPLKTFVAAVFRQDAFGNPVGGYFPAQSLARQEALRGMTIWAAKSVFREKELGSIEPGKWADLTWLDTDLMEVPTTEILKAKVLKTMIAGKVVFESTK